MALYRTGIALSLTEPVHIAYARTGRFTETIRSLPGPSRYLEGLVLLLARLLTAASCGTLGPQKNRSLCAGMQRIPILPATVTTESGTETMDACAFQPATQHFTG